MSDIREPEWTAENINRKRGDTTFVTCGWCEHVGGGSCRYDCHLTASCNLLPSWGHSEMSWDTPCLIAVMGKADLEAAVERKEREAESSRESAARSDKHAAVLKSLAARAQPLPVQPDNRSHLHFNIGDTVRAYYNRKWRRCTVVNGYRHHDGCVSFIEEGETKQGGSGMSVPSVILESEWNYFRNHPSEFLLWLKRADRKYNGETLPMAAMNEAFLAGLANPSTDAKVRV